jgi:DnaK suppressor protein
MSALDPGMKAELRADLETQLSRLEKSMAVSEEAVRTVELDQQAVGRLSRMDSLQNQSMSRNLQEREQVRYAAIRAALARMDDGSYGRCTDCGEAITPGRMMVMPEVEHCTGCGG